MKKLSEIIKPKLIPAVRLGDKIYQSPAKKGSGYGHHYAIQKMEKKDRSTFDELDGDLIDHFGYVDHDNNFLSLDKAGKYALKHDLVHKEYKDRIQKDGYGLDSTYVDKKKIFESITSNEEVKANFELAGKLTRHYSGLLTHPNKGAVQNYTHSASYDLNNHLWKEHRGLNKNIVPGDFSDVVHKLHKTMTSKIDSVLRSHKTPHDLTVWSSSIHDPRVKKNAKGIMHHPAYLSTSIYKPVAMSRDINSKEDINGEWHQHVFKIHVPKGSHGAYVDHISKIQGEYEFLLPRGSNLKYHDTDTTTKKNPWNDNIEHKHIHHMELV